ncbi:MAG: histidine kinase N-terminal 7TM domain-containing protein, partial [Dehalococcoidales bacterium]|nr:histidine kinase N-terminal 7TM domain-containing protein [Dehalococcoidales bacterium]
MNIYSILPFTAGTIYILLLCMLVVNRPWTKRHKLFVGFVAAALLWSMCDVLFRSSYLADYKLLLAKLTICSFTVMLLPFCYFVASYYEQPHNNWLVIAYISIAANVIMAMLGYQPIGIKEGVSIYPEYNIILLVAFTVIPFLILAIRSVFFLSRRLMLAENALIHAQLTYLLLTISILALSAISNIIPIGREFPVSHIGNLLAACLLGYATFRHQLLDLKAVAWTGLVYSGVTMAVAVSYLILLYVFQPWFHSQFGVTTIVFVLGVSFIM